APIQTDMFPESGSPDGTDSLQEALDKARERFGFSAVQWGRTVERVQSSQFTVHSSKPGTRNLEPGTRSRSKRA
ncbi:MAG: hypothetical protein PVJ01_01140, partial [Pseudomonadota bacterium]